MSQFNPYQNPASPQLAPQADAAQKVSMPAIALIVVAILSIVFCLLGLVFDIFLIASGVAAKMPNDGPTDPTTKILIRCVWSVILVIASGFVLFSAIKMKNLKNHSLARTGAIVAAIPCLGPCCVLGIPFGIWAFVTLNDPAVKNAFRS